MWAAAALGACEPACRLLIRTASTQPNLLSDRNLQDHRHPMDSFTATIRMSTERRVRITVWSDYVCPFCYLGEPVLERIRDELGSDVAVEWRAFELRPEPVPTLDPGGDYLHSIWNSSVYPMAQRRGMLLRLPPVQPRSRRALEAAELARERGRFEPMHHALFRAFFEDGRDLDDLEVLLEVGTSAGLDPEELRTALEQGLHTEPVLRDERLAQELGISGVPAMLVSPGDAPLEEGELVMGAQPYESVRAAVERVQRGESRRTHSGPVFRRGLPTLGD
jgi:predicted DsbA family dithiol-disulfide isomerase